MIKKIILLVALASIVLLTSCTGSESGKKETTIVFADVSWDSVQVHNRIAAFIVANGFEGYAVDFTPGDTLPLVNGMVQGDVHVNMESWHSNWPEVYDKETASGKLIDLGPNLPNAPQGWYIPRYMVEGSEAMASGLKTVADLPEYAHLFKDPEDPSKGIVYGGVAGWSQMKVSEKMFEEAALGETYNLGIAGSNAALAGSMAGAYKKGEAWIGYYWEPTAILGKLDMMILPGSEYERAFINIIISEDMPERAPDVVEFLKAYNTTVADNNQFLAKMDEEDWNSQQAAEWYLKNKEYQWTQWVSSEVAEKVKAAL